VGGEVEYVDLGHPSKLLGTAASVTTAGVPGSAKISGPALFAVAYLPVPLVDLFGKVGVSRLHSSGETATIGIVGVDTCVEVPNALGCRLFRDDRQRTSPAWGAGVQLKASPFAVRLEYERFGTGSVHPSLAGLTVNWTF
jgi:opacity protein-like surface antigen